MGQISINRMTTKWTPFVSSYYTETNILHFKSCILVHPHHLEIIRTQHTRVTQYQWHIEGRINVEWLDSLTSIINISIGSDGSKWLCITKSTVPIRYSRFVAVQICTVLTHKWHSLYGWHSARKKYSSALVMGLRLFCINPSISSLAWVWWVITRKYGEYSSLLCENAVLINMTDRDQSRYATSQWETSSQCKNVSHGLGAYLDWSLG